jgi:hypothetical protein
MMADEPNQDQTEAFLASAERGESAKVRKVRACGDLVDVKT